MAHDTAHNDVEVVDGDDCEYDSDCFITPPLPPSQAATSTVPPLDIEINTIYAAPSQDGNVQATSSPIRERSRGPAPASEDGSVFSLDEADHRSSSPEPEPEPLPEAYPKRRRGRPPKKKRMIDLERAIAQSQQHKEMNIDPISLPAHPVVHDVAVIEDGLVKSRGVFEEVFDVETTEKGSSEPDKDAEEIKTKMSQEALIPDFIIEPPDDAMFAELRAFLDREEERNVSESSEERDGEGRDEGEDVYEERRRRKLQANREILLKLGLAPPSSSLAVDEGQEEGAAEEEEEEEIAKEEERQQLAPRHKSGRRGGQGMAKPIRVDADGTTTSNPPSGLTFEVAYVDLPVLRNRTRLQHIFCEDVPALAASPAEEEDGQEWIDDDDEEEEGVSILPRGKRRRRKSQRGEDGLVDVPKRRKLSERPKGPRGEAVEGEGTTCHQCRRKTEEPKMRCRHHEQGRVCTLYWCRRCLDIRYDIDFDEDSRTFECPRCMAYCNCSLCLHRAGLKHFVPQSINAGLSSVLYNEDGERIYSSVKHYIEEKVGRAVKIGPGGLPKIMAKKEDRRKTGGAAVTVKTLEKAAAKEARETMRIERERAKQTSASMRRDQKELKRLKKLTEKQKRRAVSGKAGIKRIILKVNTPQVANGGHQAPKFAGEKESAAARRRQRSEAKAGRQAILDRMAAHAETKSAPPKRGRKTDQAPQDATVWVKSKADAVESSDEDMDDLSTLSSLEEEEGQLDDRSSSNSSEENDGEDEGEEESHVASSPPVGHVEYWDPQTTSLTQHFQSSSPMRSAQSSSEPDHTYNLRDTHKYLAGYPVHSEHELAVIMSQLRESGLA